MNWLFDKQRIQILDGYRKYRFEIRHLIVLVLVLIVFQFVVLFMNQNSLQTVFSYSQQWYQQDAAERIANLTATSLELLLESKQANVRFSESETQEVVQDFNIIFSQQLLDKNVQSICILIPQKESVAAIDNGQELFDCLLGNRPLHRDSDSLHGEAIRLFHQYGSTLKKVEQTMTIVEGQRVFHVLVPFEPHGEFVGILYMKTAPDLSILTKEMSNNYAQTALVYSGLIVIGLLAMFFVSTHTLAERNEAQHLLFEEQKLHLAEQIHHQNETLFTKRIYHTHHKAEKIVGFIKEDLRILSPENIEGIKYRIGKYANFIARVIYDMKWYDPPINTIRGAMFRTNINQVLQFIVDNIFNRVTGQHSAIAFKLSLDAAIPDVAINEYVIWEVLEPLIQNCLDHGGKGMNTVSITTCYHPSESESTVTIADNGTGLGQDLLERDEHGVQKIFLEHVTSGSLEKKHSGYGCYIAHEIATQRFGWRLEAENPSAGGSQFTITIGHS